MDSVNSVGRMPENCYSHPTCAKPAVEQPSTSGSTAQSTAVNISQSRSSDITLVTAEGDTVTLSASQTKEISFETYSSKGQSLEVSKSSEFSMTVEGDLNREELKDIRKAIRTILKAERDILKGHDEGATERTAKLAELDQIASIDAKMEFRQTVSVTQMTVETPASATETPAVIDDPEVPLETQELQELPEPTPTSVPSPVQHFTVATFDNQQQISFQYLWNGGRPIAVQGPAVPTMNSSPAAA